MRRVPESALVLLFSVAALVLASPFLLYRLGLNGVEGLPRKPVQLASREQRALVSNEARGAGTPHIAAMNPYSVALGLIARPHTRLPADERIAWSVASGHLITHQRYRGMAWWHLSGTALTIWLSRHWSDEEILSAAFHARHGSAQTGRQE